MNLWENNSNKEYPSPIRTQLQGPRPSPLKLHKDSRMIKKPPLPPWEEPALAPREEPALAPRAEPPLQSPENRQPVIIHDVSPKVIRTTVDDFIAVVQCLTGSSSASTTTSESISPVASIEKTSLTARGRSSWGLMGVNKGGSEIGYQFQGILSPAPTTLPQIQVSMFSPEYDNSLLNDLSPYLNSYMFTPSQSSLLSA